MPVNILRNFTAAEFAAALQKQLSKLQNPILYVRR